MTLLAFGNRISGPAWAREIAKISTVAQAETRSSIIATEQIDIDLSSARSADFLVLGRLLVLIHALAENGTRIVLRRPSRDLLAAEQDFLIDNDSFTDGSKETLERQISRHQRQRINCRLFMEQSGFEAALRSGPFQDRHIEFHGDESTGPQPETGQAEVVDWDHHDIPRTPQRRRGIIPYRWIDLRGSYAAPADATEQLLRSVKGLGLDIDDSEAVAQGILAELIENARDHAYPGRPADAWVLIGGELTQPESYVNRIDDFDKELRDLVSWAADEPSPLLRLFVGDNGVGISSGRQEVSGANSSDAIVEAFSTHAPHAALNREARGLWKATRVVQSFQGALLVTSGSATAGHIYEPSRDNPDVTIPWPLSLPGTTVESTILTAPSGAVRPYEKERASLARSAVGTAVSLGCVTVTLRSKLGLDFGDQRAILRRLDHAQVSSHDGLAVLVQVPSDTRPAAELDIENAISAVLDLASESTTPNAVALVFPGVSSKLLKLAIDSLNGRQDSGEGVDRQSWHRPILVVSPENAHYWVGGNLLARQLLSILSQSADSRWRIRDFASSLDIKGDVDFEQQVRNQPQWWRSAGDVVTLKVRPRDVLAALTDEFREKISDAMSAASAPGVKKGHYLTTSLRVTTRWINSRDLLQHLHLDQVAGLLLANALVNGDKPVARSAKPRVICVGAVTERAAATFSLALSGVPTTLENITAERLTAIGVTANPEQPVVVCTDVISRGAYVRRTVRELWDMGFTQVSVATLIDGRDLTYAGEARDVLRVRGRDVPLVSLAFVSLDPDLGSLQATKRKPLPIDPVTGTPLPTIYPHAQIVGKQGLYREAIKNSGAARLGHINRTGQKHFSAYVSPSTLFDYQPWKQHALDRIVRYVESDNKSISSPGKIHTIAIIYPSDAKDKFAGVAESLADAIRKAGFSCLDPVVVPRSLAGGEWAFPRFVQLPSEATHIVAVDSTSKTGRTLRELIRLASVPGVKFISCFGLILGRVRLFWGEVTRGRFGLLRLWCPVSAAG